MGNVKVLSQALFSESPLSVGDTIIAVNDIPVEALAVEVQLTVQSTRWWDASNNKVIVERRTQQQQQ
ncbi:hypothetical protein GUITHDRAFT_119871 [Guillardia theta CCMP2712]|uniref:PDZ domain-containing protein n=1 Tax=Guillardia theta (strain CCMP2712) TaxID=905079 RepID=L1IDP3_GUITC|nr:hypothetical protein GUITHDRAFT_119871 [Guillardia theta CCMP2712]EKX33945.1 hypothetical protein GUITHDRAFT_119871 [Guillardia theta CCMP2712]|eukprot:XP_005820925.1 hypothetical protein GUITHDRAFT_119871 [Guillardia theta CCMP2712]